MKILILSNFGMGLIKFRKELIESFLSNGDEVIVSFPRDAYAKNVEELGCRFIHTNVDRKGKNILKDLNLIMQYFKIAKIEKPDIILTYTIKPNLYGGLISSLLNIRYISNITGLGNAILSEGLLSKITIGFYHRSLNKAQAVFFQNSSNLKFFNDRQIYVGNSILIPGSGVNIHKFAYLEYPKYEDPLNFLFIGRIMKSKGIDELLIAIEYIQKNYKNITFNLVGFCEENYEEKLKEYQKKGFLVFHGQQDNVVPYMQQANAVIQPSHHEGMSNVLLEAAACGRPILASDIPGCKETFDEGESGLSFIPNNPESLIKTLVKFIELSYDERKKMGINGRKKIEREFNREVIVESYKNEIYKNIGGKHD